MAFTCDSARGKRVARRIQTGTIMVNDLISCFGISEAPHGGIKCSGIGRTNGRFGLEEMVRLKYLDVDRMPSMKKVWWYAYGERFGRQMEGFLDFQPIRKPLVLGCRGGENKMGAPAGDHHGGQRVKLRDQHLAPGAVAANARRPGCLG